MRRKVHRITGSSLGCIIVGLLAILGSTAAHTASPSAAQSPFTKGQSRGYLVTPQELEEIRRKADQGLEPYQSAVQDTLERAEQDWDFDLDRNQDCPDADHPKWLDNEYGAQIVYAKALAYHLTGEEQYAQEVRDILESVMTHVETISLEEQQCMLVFAWGIPEFVAAADLIEGYWYNMTCTGPTSTTYGDAQLGEGKCKTLFQNWLAKNPYYVVSLAAEQSQSNWGAAATTTLAYIADYLWDRPDIRLHHRLPPELGEGEEIKLTPAEAYRRANRLALDRMNGYRVEYGSSAACDFLDGEQQSPNWPPVKSQIEPNGIVADDARREQHCNIQKYNGEYQNYPQLHLGHVIQQCELMLRRGDSSCYDNIDYSDIPNYSFVGPDGEIKTTHLRPGRGSLERAIKAIIIDSGTEWRHDSALEVAYRYYHKHHRLPGVDQWFAELDRPADCGQDVCFGTLTHGFAPGEQIDLPPTVPPPSNRDSAMGPSIP